MSVWERREGTVAVTDEALFVSWIDIGPEAFTAGVLKFDATGAGARDTNWNATFDKSVDLLLAVPSGLFAAGNFRLCNGQVSLSLAKLDLLTGARGRDFNAQVQSPGRVYALTRQPDGKVIVGTTIATLQQEFRYTNGTTSLLGMLEPGGINLAAATNSDGSVMTTGIDAMAAPKRT